MAKPLSKNLQVIVIGAGAGGLTLAIELQRKLNCYDFTIFEKANNVGGTWRDNTYPGCACDIPSHYYSLSSDLNPDWSKSFATQPEIKAYWERITLKYDLYPHIIFETLVTSASWDSSTQLWNVVIKDLRTGLEDTVRAPVLVSALGVLEVPRWPKEIKGIDNFEGSKFHAARWDHSVPLKGKRVGVIGNGASAAQFLPIIAEDPSVEIVNFCRTPTWLVPPCAAPYTERQKWIFRNIPLAMRIHRRMLFYRVDMNYIIFMFTWTNKLVSSMMTKYIKQNAPEKYHDLLVPKYPIGCKRICRDTNYLAALHRPNVHLTYDPIDEVVSSGISLKSGTTEPLDVLICATGYVVDSYPLQVRGHKGQSIQEYYDSQGGPTAYLGTTVPGFPNFYMISGPNTSTGHASVLFTSECQIDYMLQLIAPVVAGKASSFEVTKEATDVFNDRLQAKLTKSVYMSCQSWYRKDMTGKVTASWPGTVSQFWWVLRRPIFRHYHAENGESWNRERKMGLMRRVVTHGLTIAAAASVWWRKEELGGVVVDGMNVLRQLLTT